MAFLIRHKVIHRVIFFVLVLIFISPSGKVLAEPENRLQLYEETIKTGLVYNFLKYTTWPDDDKGRLRACLFGGDPLKGNLQLLNGKTAQQSVIEISRINSVDETARCNLVFVNRNSQGFLPEILSFLKGKHVLTISDIEGFARQGGMVEMTMEDQHVILYINMQSVAHAGLNIQDRLQKLAKMVSK